MEKENKNPKNKKVKQELPNTNKSPRISSQEYELETEDINNLSHIPGDGFKRLLGCG